MSAGQDGGKRSADLRLPGSVAEIMASPPGPTIGAFFDLDGTLVAGFTAVILTQERLRRGDMGVGELLGMIQSGLDHSLGRIEFEELIGKAAAALAGRSLTELDEIGDRMFRERIESRIYPEMRELVRAHVARGHTVVLSSSALTIQVNPVAHFLGITNTLTNEFEVDDNGVLTGAVVEPILWGPGKASAVQGFAAQHGIDLAQSYFYADGDEDVALMYLVGNPRPTNPEPKMAALAKKRGWPIQKFDSRGGIGLERQVRTLLGVGSLFPVAAGAVSWGLFTWSRRRGANFFTSTFTQTLLSICGVRLNVSGQENLTAQRPAIFIFNHRNQVDPVIAGYLVRDNWVAVGKKELEQDPIVGILGKLLDGVFIDRDDPESAVSSMHVLEDRARQGLSVLIAPEGTRYDTTAVGPFKKGAFRMAIAVGIPVVPIVIRNAEIIASRNSSVLNPGTVDVAVLPPIPVDDWTLDTLSEHITEVRQLYVDTLANWPEGHVPETLLGSVKKAAGAKEPAVKAPTKAPVKAPVKKAPAAKAPVKKAPITNVAAATDPDEIASAATAPTEKASAATTSAETASAATAPAKKSPAKKVPAKKAATAKAPAKKAATKAPAKKAPAQAAQPVEQPNEGATEI